ncbi:MAG TPA: hypothetical protein VN950_21170, partial [Terriglobales bacterium]|nr:hypothetical protein [Terriglobales bacterium]
MIPKVLLTMAFFPLFIGLGYAQCTDGDSMCGNVPRLVRFSGALQDVEGQPRTGTVGITFAIYAQPSGGAPLWQEVQNVSLDQQGRYEVALGVTKSEGVPTYLFLSGEPRWVGVQANLPQEAEQPRVLLVSVPYALKAADSETLGGLPASAFVKTVSNSQQNTTTSQIMLGSPAPQTGLAPSISEAGTLRPPDHPVTTPGGTPNAIPMFSTGTSIVNSQITDSNGVVGLQNLGNILFADQFAKGVPDAINACPTSGCVIYAMSPATNLTLGLIDPGTKAITIYLGPFTYSVTQITLRKGLKIIGMGGSDNGTNLQSVNGENPVFVIPQTNGVPATNVLLSGFRVLGSVNNRGEDAFFIDASSLLNAGLWYSTFEDIYIANFGGSGLHLRGPNSNFGAGNQWLLINNLVVYRTVGGDNGIKIEGANFELHFTDCEVDGQAVGNGTNIYIGGLAGGNFSFPFVITFRGLVSQRATVAVQLDGAQSVGFYTSHHEALSSGYLITNNTNIGTRGITIADSSFFSNVGNNNGAGFLLRVVTPAAWGIRFIHNQIYGTPDSVVTGTSNVIYQDNQYGGSSTVPPTSGITARIEPAALINIGGSHSVG